MLGYGYSIWLVPYEWKKIKEEFNMDFTPHITIATNLPYLPYGILDSKKTFKVKNFRKGEVFSKMYDVDPLNAFGYSCEIEGLYTAHTPHMTLFYAPNKINELDTYSWVKSPPRGYLECSLRIANTTQSNPVQWVVY
jgi:hypothetical protein